MVWKVIKAYRFIRNFPSNFRNLRIQISNLQTQTNDISTTLNKTSLEFKETIGLLWAAVEHTKQHQADMESALVALSKPRKRASEREDSISSDKGLQADNHLLDNYYVAFENRFRGTEQEIFERLKDAYGSLLKKTITEDLRKCPIIDIGCGRGELLRLIKELGLKGVGIDLNGGMVEKCTRGGYVAVQEDALSYLQKQPSSSLAAIGGIHIVEHIPFEQLYTLLRECFRTLAPGGFVFFETPNAENIVVGSLTFWYDSSHLKPVPPDALAFVMQYVGFGETRIMRLHPERELSPTLNKNMTQEIAAKVFGPRDYAAIGVKARS